MLKVATKPFLEFLHETSMDDLPDDVVDFARRCLLDLIGVAAGGSTTDIARLIGSHAQEHFGAGEKAAGIFFQERSVSPAGAALANGMMIDALDAHDGYRPAKGHVGCSILPTLLAVCEAEGNLGGADLLTALVLGYEIGSRAGEALHASAPDYHTSGAWGAVACAALASRTLNLDLDKTRQAIGIAEYHGPRSQMMRVIDHPTMLKDGSGWGAMAGVSAAYLARDGFTGAPAISVEGDNVAEYWNDLGSRWLILEQYFKPYPVCRWAQPPLEAAMSLMNQHKFSANDIAHLEVFTFHEACRLATHTPLTTEEAQYSLPFPVAAALVEGRLGPNEVQGDALLNPQTLRLSQGMILSEHEPYNEIFPQDRRAHIHIHLNDGTTLKSQPFSARGDPEDHLTGAEIREKFHAFSDPVIGTARATTIEECIDELGKTTGLGDLLPLLQKRP